MIAEVILVIAAAAYVALGGVTCALLERNGWTDTGDSMPPQIAAAVWPVTAVIYAVGWLAYGPYKATKWLSSREKRFELPAAKVVKR